MKCFYHRGDMDGICSGAIVKLRHPECEMIGLEYGEPLPWDTLGLAETVFMVDLSLQPWEQMDKLASVSRLIWIDHHDTAMQAHEASLADRIEGIQRIGLGACALTWEYCFPEKKMPIAVRLMAEYDVWDHHNENCLPFQYGVKAMHMLPPHDTITTNQWRGVFSDDPGSPLRAILNRGREVMKWQAEENAMRVAVLQHPIEFEGVRFLAANHGPMNSKFFDTVWDADKYDAVMLYYWAPKQNAWKLNMYTDKKSCPHLGKIAEAYGGGGHHNAAGCHCAELPFKVRDE